MSSAVTSVDIDVTANDSPGSGPMLDHTVTITRQPIVGAVTIVAGNRVHYESVAGSFGNDNFEYTLTDDDGDVSAPATVQVGIGLDREPTAGGRRQLLRAMESPAAGRAGCCVAA